MSVATLNRPGQFTTPEEAYAEGFQQGLNWPDRWESHGKPGGPWVYRGGNSQWRKHDEEINKAWCIGWAEGHAEKLRTGRKNL